MLLDEVELFHLQGAPIAEIIDRQHSEIVRKRQNLRRAIVEGMGMDQIIACSQDLIDTTLDHFKSEESAMAATKFAGLEVHRLLHAGMVESVKKIWIDLEHRKVSNAMELMKFFDVRLDYHLKSEDGAFGCELKKSK